MPNEPQARAPVVPSRLYYVSLVRAIPIIRRVFGMGKFVFPSARADEFPALAWRQGVCVGLMMGNYASGSRVIDID